MNTPGAGSAAQQAESATRILLDANRTTRPGRLTAYFGAAPGVGKTHAMLDEAHRRLSRGTDVVVGYVETHDRAPIEALLGGLEVIPRQIVAYRGNQFTEFDVDAVLRRAPQVVLVDELAHTNIPGTRHGKRWQDIEEVLEAGIDVVTTVNVQHLESLNDAVEAITDVRQRETVPDHVLRQAYQIHLIDFPPEALRRRLAHGNIYRADQIDASLSSYFRVGNLTALRELALLWLADRVDDALTTYRREHAISEPWPARERIVVAVTGGAESETLIRRGARIAQRGAGSELLAVHILAADGLVNGRALAIDAQRRLVQELDGTFHTVVGDDVPTAVVDFARGVNASMIVVGVSRRSRWQEALTESNGVGIARLADTIDVHLVTHEQARTGRRRSRRGSPLPAPRTMAGWILAILGPASLVALLMRAATGLPTQVMLFLALTVGVALVGGILPAMVSAVMSFLLLNWFFTPPTGQLTIADPEYLLALAVFLLVAGGVASVVDLAERRSSQATKARAEAATLAEMSRSVLSGDDTAHALVSRLRRSFDLTAVSLLSSSADGKMWHVVAASGSNPPHTPDEAQTIVGIDATRVLALRGRTVAASDQRVLEAFASQAGNLLEYHRLRRQAEQAHLLEHAEATRTALLAAVSHDLRTPLATIRAAVDGLVAPGPALSVADTAALVDALGDATARLERLIDNLLDLSRLQTGNVMPALRATSLDEVVPLATDGFQGGVLRVEVADTLPLIHTDPGLLERVIANIVSNAVRHSRPDVPVLVRASTTRSHIELRVIDRGPGVPDDLKEHMFEPFQRLGDSSPSGLGLGLAVAQGLATAVGAELVPEDTPGGGLTMVLNIPLAEEVEP